MQIFKTLICFRQSRFLINTELIITPRHSVVRSILMPFPIFTDIKINIPILIWSIITGMSTSLDARYQYSRAYKHQRIRSDNISIF